MATTTNFATAASGTSWTTPTNANADDAAYATYTIAAKNTTGNVNSLSSFGFDAAIPVGATINSVTLEVQHKVSTTGGVAFLESALAIGATVGTYNSDSAEPTTDTIRTYSALARPGGGTWTRADLLDATFTVKLRARSGNNATSVVYSWDYATVTVDYTPQAFTLTALAGAYAITGQSATVSRDKLVEATAGSYTLTGVNATLAYTPAITGFELTALAGSYALTGQAATVSRNRTLTASAGSYTLSGVNADLTKSKLITASAGGYTLAGQNADLAYVAPGKYVLTALAGSYTLTGSAATLTYSTGQVVGKRFKTYAKAYLKRDNEVLVFNSEADKEAFVSAEQRAKQAINRAQRRKVIATQPKPVRVDLTAIEAQAEQFEFESIQPLIVENNFSRILEIHHAIQQMLEDEDIEILLLA